MSACIFCKIVAGEIPCSKIFEDEHVIAFNDIHPQAKTHILVIPRLHIATLADVKTEHTPILGAMLAAVPLIARAHGCAEGWRTIINTGRMGGQEVYHLHVHIVGGQALPAMLKY
jgi:histidine triad (HIT) family protein